MVWLSGAAVANRACSSLGKSCSSLTAPSAAAYKLEGAGTQCAVGRGDLHLGLQQPGTSLTPDLHAFRAPLGYEPMTVVPLHDPYPAEMEGRGHVGGTLMHRPWC